MKEASGPGIISCAGLPEHQRQEKKKRYEGF